MDRLKNGYLTFKELVEFRKTIEIISRTAKGYHELVSYSDLNNPIHSGSGIEDFNTMMTGGQLYPQSFSSGSGSEYQIPPSEQFISSVEYNPTTSVVNYSSRTRVHIVKKSSSNRSSINYNTQRYS